MNGPTAFMIKPLSLLAATAGLLLTSPAAAQLASGYSGTSSAPTEGVPDDYWYLLRQIGPCVAQMKRRDAAAFLAAAPGSSEETRAFKKLFGSQFNSCMRNFVSASFVRAHLRGAVAEGLYELTEPVSPNAQPAVAGSEPARIRNLHDFARCYVAGHASQAHALMTETMLGSDEELRMLSAMAGDFAACLPAEREVKLKPTDVRMVLAEALYRAAQFAEVAE